MTATGEKWPTRDDYQSAVLHPQRNVKDARLHATQVEMRQLGMLSVPFPRSGNFGAVYKFIAPSQSFALKVFASTQPDREQRYRLIDAYLKSQATSSHLVSFSYDQAGIRVQGRWYPTLIMDWIEGATLDTFLLQTLQQRGQVDNRALCQAWVDLMLNVSERRLAHGDLQHGNILVLPNGAMKLVDYDGMFVPAMKAAGLTASEIGLPAYQHPKRYRGYFDERLDHFAALVILLSLASVNKPRWQRYHTDDNCLLVRESDLLHPEQSPLLNELTRTAEAPLKKLANILKAASIGSLDAIPSFQQLTQDSTIRQLWTTAWRPTATAEDAPRARKPVVEQCRNCLTEIEAGNGFCIRCGTPVNAAAPLPPKSTWTANPPPPPNPTWTMNPPPSVPVSPPPNALVQPNVPLSVPALIGESLGILITTVFYWWLASMLVGFVMIGLGSMVLDKEVATELTKWAIGGLFVFMLLGAIARIVNLARHGKPPDPTS